MIFGRVRGHHNKVRQMIEKMFDETEAGAYRLISHSHSFARLPRKHAM
jgi:hypothetical protein